VSTFKELKERRLVQIVVSYAVAGWVVLSIFGEVIDRGVLPELLYRVLLVLYFGGLVASVIAGWYHGEKGHQKVTRMEVALLGIVAVATLGGAGMTIRQHFQMENVRLAAGEAGLDLRRLAVLYFQDLTRGEDLAYLADGLTESLILRLSESQTLDVLSENASGRFRDPSITLDSIGRALSVGTLVDGSVERRGENLRVNFSLHDGASGAEIQRGTVERPAEDLFALQDEVAKELGTLLGGWLTEEVDLREAREGTESVVAWTLFQRGERKRNDGAERWEDGDLDGFTLSYREADSLFAEAERADPNWAPPLTQRALLSDLLAQAAIREDPRQAESWLNAGVQYADRALILDSRSSDAHLVRGRLEYFRWRTRLAATPRESDQAFEKAMADLQEATRLDASLAEAWMILSVLHSEQADNTEAKLAARRALEADEFLRNADEVLFRLYTTSYDLEQFRDATEYCDEGLRRFPRHALFRECRLWLLAAPYAQAPEPDPDEAWDTLERFLELLPSRLVEYQRLKGQILVAGTLGRAELTDSAEAVLIRSRATPDLDPELELMGYEALVRLHMGQKEEALDLLKTYLTTNPHHREGWQWTAHWWWRPLQEEPEFRALMEG
jgi:TolB-like protein/tetratricopeptide (TPR) repeat protein